MMRKPENSSNYAVYTHALVWVGILSEHRTKIFDDSTGTVARINDFLQCGARFIKIRCASPEPTEGRIALRDHRRERLLNLMRNGGGQLAGRHQSGDARAFGLLEPFSITRGSQFGKHFVEAG